MRFSLTISFFLYSIALLGQPNQAKYLSLQEGLSSQQVIDVVHDKNGFIWIATEMGLNRFSSNSFKQYYKSEKADGLSVNSNEINTLLYDNSHLYIGTRANGLNVYDLKTNRFSYYLHDSKNLQSIATNDITDIIKSKSGKLWLSTYHQGVQRFDPLKETFERFNKYNLAGLPENSVWTLAEDKNGLLYIGHVNKGLSILNPNTRKIELIQNTNTQHLLPDNEVKSLLCDSKNNIWVGTRKGLAVYLSSTKKIKHISLAGQSKNGTEPFVYSIKEIDGELWIGAESSQLFILKSIYNHNGELQSSIRPTLYSLNSGNHSSIQNIDRDEFGNMWLGIYGGGLAFLGHIKPFFSTLLGDDLGPWQGKAPTVTGILNGSDNSISLATVGDGVIQISPAGNVKKITTQNSNLGDNFILSGFQDSKNNKWFGLQNGGVSLFETATKTWRKIEAGEKMTAVRAIVEDRQGNICFAAEEGLFIYNPKLQTFQKIITNKPMLGDYAPRTLVEDQHGNLWIGTYGQGLYIVGKNGILIRRISKGEGLNSNTINHLFIDRRNNIWIATNEGLVLQRVDKSMGELENIPPPGTGAWLTVNAIGEDQSGNIWCSTRSGLLRYLLEEKRFLSYDQSFGLPMGGFINNSVGTDHKGRLFFGMPAGVCYFNPMEIPLHLPTSPIRISRFIVFNTGETHAQTEKHPGLAEEINLQHDENSFRVELAVMDYALNDMVEFSYQLHGLDGKWVFLGNEKNLDFRNIPYGDYELRIRTRQKNENWSKDYRKLFINITPPFYLNTLALVVYSFLALLIVVALLFFHVRKVYAEAELRVKKLQIEQDQKLHIERMNFYTNITHELRTPLTLILGPLEDLLQEEKLIPKHKDWVVMVQKNANRLFSLVNQLLEFRKVESQNKPLVLGEGFLGELIQQIVQKHKESNNKPDLSICFTSEQQDIKTTFDAEIVQLILDNLLSNASKYTSSGAIRVKLSYEQDRLSTRALIYVKDTGCGIAPEHLEKIFERYYQVPRSVSRGTGVGLALVKELVAIHHGKITLNSELGKGSEFCVQLLTNAVSNTELEIDELAYSTSTAKTEEIHPLILLVEDEKDLREYLFATLSINYEVITADNGAEGLALAIARIPDLILSDVMMPDMDGFMMLEKLKDERETSHIPIIFLSAKDTDADKEHGYELGVDSYLTKPISSKLLNSRIENLLVKRKAIYTEILAQLHSKVTSVHATKEPEKSELWRENTFVQEFVSLVEGCIQDEVLDVTTLAEKMNMSQSTLYRKLKAITGKNINQLVRKVRIQKAAQLLSSGNHNVTEVALLVGINSPIYFRQCFKEEFGQLPSEYQKKR